MVVSAGKAAVLEAAVDAAAVVAHTAFLAVQGGEEAVAAAFAAVASLAVVGAGCGWCLHLAVVAENLENTH